MLLSENRSRWHECLSKWAHPVVWVGNYELAFGQVWKNPHVQAPSALRPIDAVNCPLEVLFRVLIYYCLPHKLLHSLFGDKQVCNTGVGTRRPSMPRSDAKTSSVSRLFYPATVQAILIHNHATTWQPACGMAWTPPNCGWLPSSCCSTEPVVWVPIALEANGPGAIDRLSIKLV